MNKAHLPAVWDVWLLDKEHWLLLSPDLGSTVAGVSAPCNNSVGPSLVAEPVLPHTRGCSCCTGFLGPGQARCVGTPEMVQDAPRSGSVSLCRIACSASSGAGELFPSPPCLYIDIPGGTCQKHCLFSCKAFSSPLKAIYFSSLQVLQVATSNFLALSIPQWFW